MSVRVEGWFLLHHVPSGEELSPRYPSQSDSKVAMSYFVDLAFPLYLTSFNFPFIPVSVQNASKAGEPLAWPPNMP